MYLNVHSYFSLRYGTLSISRLMELARHYGIKAMALTDINNSTGMIDFVRSCREHGIKPIGGMEFRNGNKPLYTGIARNIEGMRELNEYVSYHNINKIKYPARPEFFENACVVYPLESAGVKDLRENEFVGKVLSSLDKSARELDPETLARLRHIRTEAIDMSIMVASRILERSLDDADHRKLAQDILKEV